MNQNQRFCLTLDLQSDPDLIREYLHWHKKENIWPEIPDGIRAAGILDMEIYRLETRLFMIIETAPDFDFETNMEYLSNLPRQKEWEAFMSRFQLSGSLEKPAEKWKRMDKIFGLI